MGLSDMHAWETLCCGLWLQRACRARARGPCRLGYWRYWSLTGGSRTSLRRMGGSNQPEL